MPRKPRIEYPGAIYHVMSRANGKGSIFETDVDRQDFVKTLAEATEGTHRELNPAQRVSHSGDIWSWWTTEIELSAAQGPTN